MKFFFLPFAGGSQYSYNGFANYAAKWYFKVVPVELPGRGGRFREPLMSDLDDLVEDILRQVKKDLESPYGIFGHSMGAILGYLLTKKIIELNLPQPFHLFFSGCGGPSIREEDMGRHLLTKKEFVQKLKDMGGCPDELLRDDGLLQIFEPVIRADFKAVDTYVHQSTDPFDIPVTVLIGADDKTTRGKAFGWQEETTRQIDVIEFEGGHFFLFGKEREIVNIMATKVRSWVYL